MINTERLIRLENVSIGYKGKPILKDINISVSRGQSLSISGPNGGGKTTFLKTVVGLLPSIKGAIQRKDNIVFGYVPQNENFDPLFPISVTEIVAMGRYSRVPFCKRIKKQDWKIVDESIAKVDIEHLKNSNFNSLSGGEKQRTLIARAIAGEPDLLVLDEPTSSIDTKGEREIVSLIKKLTQGKSCSIIMVNHSTNTINNFAEKFVFIDKDQNVFRIDDNN